MATHEQTIETLMSEISCALGKTTSHGLSIEVELDDDCPGGPDAVTIVEPDGTVRTAPGDPFISLEILVGGKAVGWLDYLKTPSGITTWSSTVRQTDHDVMESHIIIPDNSSPAEAAILCLEAINSNEATYFVSGYDWQGDKKRVDVKTEELGRSTLKREFITGTLYSVTLLNRRTIAKKSSREGILHLWLTRNM